MRKDMEPFETDRPVLARERHPLVATLLLTQSADAVIGGIVNRSATANIDRKATRVWEDSIVHIILGTCGTRPAKFSRPPASITSK